MVADVPVQIVLRPYASSIPLASFAFGIGNVLYSAFLLHWIPQAESGIVALMLLAFVAPLELAPSAMAFLARDSGGATAFAIFGAAWIVQGLELLLHSPQQSHAAGLFLFCLALCLALLMAVTFHGKPLLGGILIVAVIRTCGAGVLAFREAPLLTNATGIAGLVLALLAFYAGFAFLEEDVTSKLSPLTLRSGEAKAAMEGPLEDQIKSIENEAGVRKQL